MRIAFRRQIFNAASACRALAIAAAIMVGAFISPAAVRSDAPTQSVEIGIPLDVEIARLVGDLGSQDWNTREVASLKLEQKGSPIFPMLQAAFRQSEHFEVRNRIKRVVHEINLDEQIGPVRAFLGIQHLPGDQTTETDSRLLPGSSALALSYIVPGSAAEAAGLRAGDLLVGLNGQRASDKARATDFVIWIGAQLPGIQCDVSVLRGGEGRILTRSSAHSGFDPRGFKRVKTRLVLPEDDRRLPEGTAGLSLVEVAQADSRLGLEPGDMIVALDGDLLQPDSAQARFDRWVVDQAPKDTSVQIVRGGEVRDFRVTLMPRPSNLRGGRAWQRNTNDRKVSEADAAFEVLWDGRFATEGRSADRTDAEAAWSIGK